MQVYGHFSDPILITFIVFQLAISKLLKLIIIQLVFIDFEKSRKVIIVQFSTTISY